MQLNKINELRTLDDKSAFEIAVEEQRAYAPNHHEQVSLQSNKQTVVYSRLMIVNSASSEAGMLLLVFGKNKLLSVVPLVKLGLYVQKR